MRNVSEFPLGDTWHKIYKPSGVVNKRRQNLKGRIFFPLNLRHICVFQKTSCENSAKRKRKDFELFRTWVIKYQMTLETLNIYSKSFCLGRFLLCPFWGFQAVKS